MNPYAAAMADHIATYKEMVLQDTFGHLAPNKNVSYKGSILFSAGGYSATDKQLIDSDFAALNDSPWLYDAMVDYIGRFEYETAGVYRMDCTFRNYRFYGKPRLVYSLLSPHD